jgi:hypothetical protein
VLSKYAQPDFLVYVDNDVLNEKVRPVLLVVRNTGQCSLHYQGVIQAMNDTAGEYSNLLERAQFLNFHAGLNQFVTVPICSSVNTVKIELKYVYASEF